MTEVFTKDKDPKTKSFDTKRHRWTDREVKTPVTKRDTGIKRLLRLFSMTKDETSQRQEQHSYSHYWRFEEYTVWSLVFKGYFSIKEQIKTFHYNSETDRVGETRRCSNPVESWGHIGRDLPEVWDFVLPVRTSVVEMSSRDPSSKDPPPISSTPSRRRRPSIVSLRK